MKVAVVGVTGLVGQVMLKVLEERNFPVTELVPVASERSVGKTVQFKGKDHTVVGLQTAVDSNLDLAIFSAGGSVSKEWAPKFADKGTFVVDNSSAWRMDPSKKLVVPEVNANVLTENDKIIANPNCSTIQMIVALGPLHKKYGIKRLVISTYQSFTGTGVKAVKQYTCERDGIDNNGADAYPYQIFENCLPHCDVFFENGYTKEEMKLVHETRKILGDQSLKITATAVRVPVDGGHSESVNVELSNPFDIDEVRKLLANSDGIVVKDDIKNNVYPMPLYSKNLDPVFVGRIRRDESLDNGLNLWIVADNLRKGAATNAVQISEYLIKSEILKQRVLAS